MKSFDKLTIDQYTKIINERINTILEIPNKILEKFIPINSLEFYHIEWPPILSDKSHLSTCLIGTGEDDLGKLQRFYLQTYIADGVIKFRSIDENRSEMWVYFDRNYNWVQLTNSNNKFIIDGLNHLRGIYLEKIVSQNAIQFPLAPSLSLKITIDGKTLFDQSIYTLISSFQTNPQIAMINKMYFDFNEMSVALISTNEEIKFDCSLVFL